ncbi:MAG: Ig-like domain repeat protein [Terracidiphilus sp.]|nr:Ig-like domain repeat protein [Terracidiphilus sp.]MDR3776223.1 Ig-like domain repeat protein [Terracidiphilus sp.]
MSSIPVEIVTLKMHECQLPVSAATAVHAAQAEKSRGASHRRLPGAARFALCCGRAWMLALAALLLTAVGAQAQNGIYVFTTPQAVGTMSGVQNVTVTAQVAGQVAAVQVLTLGTSGHDFAPDASALCGTPRLGVGETCTESVTFTPAYPGLRMGAVVLLDSVGNVLGTTYLSGTGVGGLGVLVTGNITRIAGNGGYKDAVVDNIPATLAELYVPSSVTLDGAGNMYIADTFHSRIRKVAAPISPATVGIITTIAGTGIVGYDGTPQLAVNATLTQPGGVALDGAGNLYIADTGNNVVRKITASTGMITTVAGNGTAGYAGDGLAATSPTVELNAPQNITVDGSANLYIADTVNNCIRRVDAVTGIITTVAGNGTVPGGYGGDNLSATSSQTKLNLPDAVAFDPQGNMYIADSLNYRVRKVNISTGIISTFAGTGLAGSSGDGGPANVATLDVPSGVIVDPAGNVYIADTQNAAIRKVNSATGIITTIASSGIGKYLDPTSGQLVSVGIYGPLGLCLDGRGDLLFADSLNMAIRQIQSNLAVLDFTGTAVRQGDKSTPQKQTVENDGNAPLDVTPITLVTNSALDPTATTCATSSPLAISSDCTIGAVFAPTVAGNPLAGDIDVGQSDATKNLPLDIRLIGIATLVNSTTVVVTSNINPSGFGQNVTFTATLSTGASTGNLTGTVSFFDGGKALGPANLPLVASGNPATATFTTSALTVGLHTITASYSGDKTHFAATSTDNSAPPLIQTVNEATVTNLTTSGTPSVLGASVTFTATVTASNGGGVVPDGTVILSDGATILGPQTLDASGVATLQTATLATGLHSITAAYGGDAAKQILGSTSNTVNQDVQASSTAVVISSGSPSVYGTSVTFTATVTPNGTVAATGLVKFFDGAAQLGTLSLNAAGQTTFATSSLAVGPHTITVVYQGDTNYSAATSPAITQTVTQAQTLTAVVALPNPGIAGKAVAITATVTVAQGVATPQGTVTFTDNGAALGTATLSNTGMATINQILTPGSHSIIASYGGDTNDATSISAALPLAVILATTQTAVSATPTSALVLAPVTIVAKVTGNGGVPTGTVTFLSDNASIGTATLDATGTATFTTSGLVAGSHALSASYSGDANDSPSASGPVTETVGTIPTVTDLGTSTTSGTNPQVILVATVLSSSGPTPTGTVTFTSGSSLVGASTLNSSGIATLVPNLASGTYNIIATYSGDAQHSPSTSQAVQVTAIATGFNLTVTPASVSVVSKQNATVTVAMTSISGFTDTIGLGCSSLPAGVTCHFSSISAVLKADAVQSVQLTIDTNNPLSGGSSAMNTHTEKPGTYLAGLLLPFSLFFGWILWRFRKRHAALLTTVLLLLLSGAAMLATGCSGMSSSSAAPGTYVIQVTGTGASSNIIHYQNVTLTITK